MGKLTKNYKEKAELAKTAVESPLPSTPPTPSLDVIDTKGNEAPLPSIMTFPASRMTQQLGQQLGQFGINDAVKLQSLGQTHGTLTGQTYGALATSYQPPPAQAPKRERVAIVGTAPSSRMLTPFNDLSWDIWVCSPGNMEQMPRIDAWFEIHKNLLWPECIGYGKPYIEWLSKQTFPVYMQDQSYFPHAKTFPAQEMVNKFGGDFFTSSFAWMMAFAIARGYKEIGLFGVDMASKDEYILQRQGFFFWLKLARDSGIKVTIPPESDLIESPGLYGYSEATRFGRKMNARKQELLGRVAQFEQAEIPKLQAQLKGAQDNVTYLKGAIEDLEYITSIWPRIGHTGEQNG